MVRAKRRVLRYFTATLLICAMVVTAVMAAEAWLGVYPETQDMSKWCWAACTEMACKFYGESPTQSAIVQYVFGRLVNSTASVFQIESALAHWNVDSYATSGALSFSNVKVQINNTSPVIAGRNTHATIIYGYYENTGSGIYRVYYIDPATGAYEDSLYADYSSTWNGGSVYEMAHY